MSLVFRIRTYLAGCGHCSLVSFPDGQRQRHMLVNFGLHPGESESSSLLKEIAENIRDETGGRLDVVVLSNQQHDHLAAFYSLRSIFKHIQVDHVWTSLAAQPNYYNDFTDAQPLKRLQDRLGNYRRTMQSRGVTLAPSFEAMMANNLRDAKRIHYASGLAGDNLHYLRRGNSVAGKPFSRKIKVQVLAPERDLSDYFDGWMGYLTSLEKSLASASGGSGGTRDFWQFPDEPTVSTPPNLLPHDWNQLHDLVYNEATDAVRSIDKTAKNSSLVLMLEVAGRRLLLSGSAEIESWQMIDQKCQRQFQPVDFLTVTHLGDQTLPQAVLDGLLPKSRKQNATVMVSPPGNGRGQIDLDFDGVLLTALKARCKRLLSAGDRSGRWVDIHF